MTALADRTIAALRVLHDDLAGVVPTLTEAQLTVPSGASEWTVAQVLSHLGSGSEIALASYRSALTESSAPGPDFNQQVWARWDAMSPQDQANGFVEHDARLVETVEGLSADQRANLLISLGFGPSPFTVATVAGLRLNEVALHHWDVRVALDPTVGVNGEAAAVLLEQFSGALGFILGFVGKADALAAPAVVDVSGFGLVIADQVSVRHTAEGATATFDGPLEAAVRLVGGRLRPEYTPDAVRVVGNVDLDDLRRVFPGF